MAEAEVGDEQLGEDPTVNALCRRVADLLGQESALFLPSGTMCNQIAIASHCRPGDEIIAAESAHILTSEGAGAAVLAGALVRSIQTPDGVFGALDLDNAIRQAGVKAPVSRLVSIEQTSNRGGGTVWPAATIAEVATAARAAGLLVHMDGARLMNAVVASGEAASIYTPKLDSVWLDLSKGLGCPVGAVLAGSNDFISRANVWKHRLGGAMRQAGIIAAAGLYALDNNIERLAEDHANARIFADRLAAIDGIELAQPRVETNLVFFDVGATGLAAPDIARRLHDRAIRIGAETATRMRAVTHLGVDRQGVEEAADALAEIVRIG
jgi:threonine aldolase